MSPSPLPHIHDLISDSWRSFRKHWNESIRITKWALLVPVVLFVLILVTTSSPTASAAILSLGNVGIGILTIWISTRLLIWGLHKEDGRETPKNEDRLAWRLFFPILGIGLLNFFAIAGGFIAFVLPGIWMAILFGFAPLILLTEDRHGFQALAASAALVKGRWWPTFWRMAIPNLVFLVLYAAFIGIVGLIIGLIGGNGILQSEAVLSAANTMIQGIGQFVFASLFVWVQVKVFKALKETR